MTKIINEKDGSLTNNIEPIPFAGLVTITEPEEATVAERRYCTSCQVMRPADYGKMIKAGKINRWKCTACFKRINVPRYAKKTQQNLTK